MEMPQQGGGALGVEGPGGGAPLSPPLSPASAAAAALANARWNPTKEQVAALEELYENGLRTPSAEQIKQITARLREHGHIEAKNVFYWFQNHKARQRQKQKQDSFAYFTRLLRRPPPLPVLARPPGTLYPHGRLPVPAPPASPAMAMAMPTPPAAAAACNSNSNSRGTHVMYRTPFYVPAPQAPAANAAYYRTVQEQQQLLLLQQQQVLYPRMEVAQDKMIPAAAQQQQPPSHPAGSTHHVAAPSNASSAPLDVLHLPVAEAADAGPSRETLQLFPLQPTFLLPDKGRATAGTLASTASAMASFSGESEGLGSPDSNGEEAPALPFYDFFSLQSGGR